MKKLLLPFLLFLLPGAWNPGSLEAQEYSIPLVRAEVEVRDDGSLRVTERFTYEFDGSFTWAHRSLPSGEDSGYRRIRNVRIEEDGAPFINENSEEPGTFLVRQSNDMIDFRWFFEAEDERRTFLVSYTLDGAVVIGPEWSEFFWNYVAEDRERATDSLAVTLRLPREVPADSLHAWGRGPLQRISVSRMPGRYDLRAFGIGSDESVALRAVFPSSAFDRESVSVDDRGFTLARARQDEREYREERRRNAERDARLAGIGERLAVLIVLLGIGGFGYFYARYGRRHDVAGSASSRESLMIPGPQKPALIGWLLANRRTTGGHLTATLLDLARRGFFRLRERPPEKGWLSSDEPVFLIESTDERAETDLPGWERDVLEFVRDRLGDSRRELGELFEQSSSAFSGWFSSWKKNVESDVLSRGWIDQESYPGAYRNAGLQSFLCVLSIACIVMAGPIAVFATLITLFLAVLSVAIIRRTPRGETLYRNWKNYESALSSGKGHPVRRGGLDRHFIHAVALGADGSDIESLFEANPDADVDFPWIVILDSTGSSPASLGTAFSTLNATGSASFGGATGAAGGASAGAAGGGGSAGAG